MNKMSTFPDIGNESRGLTRRWPPFGLGLDVCLFIFHIFEFLCISRMAMPACSSWKFLLYSTVFEIILLSFLLIILRDKKKRGKLPPGPPGWPIVGNLFQLGKKPNESLLQLAKKYGPLMSLRLGMKTAIVVSSPAMAREVFKNHDHLFAGRTVIQAAKCASHDKSSLVWSQYGPRWRMLRKICNTELFGVRRLNALQHLRRDQIFQTIRSIYEENYLKRNTVTVGHTAFLTSLNLLGNMIFTQNIFGRDSEAAEELNQTISKATEISGAPNLADYFPFLQILDPQGITRAKTLYLKQVYGLLDKFVEDRLSSAGSNHGAPEKDFLDVLIDCYRNADGGENAKITRTDITPLIYDLITAGSDTSSTTIEWGLAELIRNPQAMKRSQAELDDVVGRDRQVEESDIQHLPYLNAVVKEVFRLHPPAPLLLPHRADTSCEIAGFFIPKDAQVIVNVWGMGRDPSIWKDPMEFAPERFTESEMDFKGNNMELIPFGAGRRICPGLPLANRMVHFVLAALLHSFDWSLPDGRNSEEMEMTGKFGLTLQKASPLMAVPTPRLPAILY